MEGTSFYCFALYRMFHDNRHMDDFFSQMLPIYYYIENGENDTSVRVPVFVLRPREAIALSSYTRKSDFLKSHC